MIREQNRGRIRCIRGGREWEDGGKGSGDQNRGRMRSTERERESGR